MNCQEFKKLTGELVDLDKIAQNSELSTHLSGCEACQSFLKYERKLREGFVMLGNEPMPADVARKILAIPQNEPRQAPPRWLEKIHALLNSFAFKVAFASGITGFLLAVFLLRSPNGEILPGQRQHDFAAHPSVSSPPSEPKKVFTPAKRDVVAEEAAARKNTFVGLQSIPEQIEKLGGKGFKDVSSDKIPGAVTYALERNKAVGAMHAADVETIRFSEVSTDVTSSESDMLLAKSESESQVMSKKTPFMPHAGFAAAPILLEERHDAESSGNEIEDPRSIEIFELLRANNLAEAGFVDLEKLLMRGYISSRQFREWQPPTGSNWYVISKDSGSQLVLRKKP